MPAGTSTDAARLSISFRAVVGLAFSLILLLSGGGLVWLDHRSTLHLLQEQADARFDDLVAQVKGRLSQQFSNADAVLDTLAMAPPPTADPRRLGLTLARVLANLMQSSPAALSILTADGDGDYVFVDGLASPRFDSDYVVRIGSVADGATSERVLRVDRDFAVVHESGAEPVSFDPRVRPWFSLATAGPKAVTTPLYLFRNGHDYGFTLSRRADDDPHRVFGIDIRLDSLSSSLQNALSSPGEHVALFTPDGALLGDSDRLQIASRPSAADPLDLGNGSARRTDAALYEAYRQGRASRDAILSVDGRALYANLAEITVNGTTMILGSTVSAEVFEGPATELLLWSVLLQGCVVVLAFVLVTLASRSIARPIVALASDVENITQFRFQMPRRQTSRIREIQRVSAAVDTLDLTLRTFSTYLPQAFVRAIVAGRRAPGLGGRRERLVVMFSDIDGFTHLSEDLPPDVLLGQLARYFAVISDEILASGGTLDKFIGDSVMAFWPVPEHATDRIDAIGQALLRTCRRLDELNAQFSAEGRPILNTRFGLNVGEGLVGSVGTAERMNYTVLGHVVNVAARIERLNKEFGTRILVSGALRTGAGPDLSFRLVATLPVRGTQQPIELYELLESPAARSAAAAE